MTDPRETLARIRKQADNATEGPWQTDTSAHVLTVDNTPNFVALCADPDYSDAGVPDAEFIAAARTTVPALLDLADAVFDLHRRSDHTRLVGFPRADREEHYCMEDQKPWPCPTFTAITTALEKIA